jgi:hypothetical protein
VPAKSSGGNSRVYVVKNSPIPATDFDEFLPLVFGWNWVVLLTCRLKDPAWTPPPCGWVLGRDFGVF